MSGYTYLRKDTGSYYIRFKDKSGRWITENIGKVSKPEAEKILSIRKAEVYQGKYNLADKTKKVKFEKWVNEYKTILKDRRAKNRLKPLFSFFKGKLLNKITVWDVERFKSERNQQVSKSETNKELKLLKRCMKSADDNGYKNRISKCKLPLNTRLKEKRDRILTPAEEQLLKDTTKTMDLTAVYNYIVIGINTGMRPKEIYHFKFSDIDWQANRLHIYQTKAECYKHIPINQQLKSLLLVLADNQKGEYVLTNNDKPFHNSYFAKLWRRVRNAAGLDNEVIPYCLRHTFCTRLVEAGVPIRRLMKYSGHKTLSMVMRYTHPVERNEDLELLDRLKPTDNIQRFMQKKA